MTSDVPRPHRRRGRFQNRYNADQPRALTPQVLEFFWQMRKMNPTGAIETPMKPDVDWLKANRTVPALTWIGHSTFLFQRDGLNLITDPHLTQRASPFKFAGPKRFVDAAMSFGDLPKLDLALVSHNHYDHLDEISVKRLAREHAELQFVVPLGLKRWFLRRGIRNVVELDLWDSAEIRGLKIHCVPVQHFSGRGAHDRNATLWCGFVVEMSDGYKLFFAGDTGYSRDFHDIGAKFAPIDLSLIPIGAYDPRWFMAPVHVNPEEAVRIHQDVKSKQSVAMHWGTFRLTLEPLDEPPQKLREALAAARIGEEKFWVLAPGETRRL
ncbi:MAG TPA: MBL fold metallo-hydrolase [Nevskiaceae bacterium]|nr:MBL fold metallo-hydrolase [Nevskiaceae bacterium]